MKHLGDITKISGYTAPIVDCIIGGSPCQDLSVAGKRAGLDGERSGLYIEQVRIVKEMRKRDERNGRTGVDVRPRYMVWENVPGAFSSNKGEDFRIVLEEIAKVCDKDAVIPMPDKGKWTNSGSIVADGWSVAWRVLDAQFWGVPQRRRRIALVADFGGQSAPEILFVRQSVSGHIDESKPKRKGAASDAQRGFGTDDYCPNEPIILQSNQNQAGICQNGKCYTLTAAMGMGGGYVPMITSPAVVLDSATPESLGADQYNGVVLGGTVSTHGVNCGMSHGRQCVLEPSSVYSVENHPHDSRVGINEDGKVQALTSRMGTGGGNVPMVLALDRASFNQGKNAQFDFEISDKGINPSLVAKGPSAVCYSVDQGGGKSACNVSEGQAPTLTCTHGGEPAVCYPKEIHDFVEENNADAPHQQDLLQTADGVARTLAPGTHAAGSHLTKTIIRVGTKYIVRRLTPLECERLQGYPDGWTDIGEWTDTTGKKRQTSDAARYKALGNSISLPNWKWVLKRLCACYERDATMASLFDGIGGFPYLWEQLNGKGSCLWASEIEEFPIAVTKVRIGE